MKPDYIDEIFAQFLKSELECGDARRTKMALQEICKLHRGGLSLREPTKSKIETVIAGLLSRLTQDLKVVRWCLNAIAQFGRRDHSLSAVNRAIELHGDDPDIAGAAVAALFKVDRRSLGTGISAGLQREIIVLGALQNAHPKDVDVSGVSIDIEKSSPGVLKLALITVGIGRAVENLFDPRHPNSAIVRALGKHDDDIVRQYSVWAILENDLLGPQDLGVDLENLRREPPNVRAKVYSLLAHDGADRWKRQEYLIEGSEDEHSEARGGLAVSLGGYWYDGMEEVTVPWIEAESDSTVKEALLSHFSRFATECPAYEEYVLEEFQTNPSSQDRLMGMAAGKSFYRKLKLKQLEGDTMNLFDTNGRPLNKKEDNSLKILMLSASPLNEDRLRVDEENREINRQIRSVSGHNITISSEFAVKVSDLQGHLLRERPAILHFSGHGSSSSAVVMEDSDGKSFPVDPDALTDLLRMFKDDLKCVILNCCYSNAQAMAIAKDIPIVIGSDDSVGDQAASTFSYAFYRSLAHGRSIEEAFKFGVNEIDITLSKSESKMYRLHA